MTELTERLQQEIAEEVKDYVERREFARKIAGALRAAINDHGPITKEHIGSATKRILGQLGLTFDHESRFP